ncbi:MAG: hypothetical protein JJE25_08995 [Bacteroidia bacterium]|nr:hypothetical protein [Bacteroidia bacterium]
MKRVIGLVILGIIFMNIVLKISFPAYPLLNNLLVGLSLLSITSMLFILFLEESINAIFRSVAIVFGTAGVVKLILSFLSLNSFFYNIILLAIITVAILAVIISGYFRVASKE